MPGKRLDQGHLSRNNAGGTQKPNPGQRLLFLPHTPLCQGRDSQTARQTQKLPCLPPKACLPSPALHYCRARVSCRVAGRKPKLGVVPTSIITYSLTVPFQASGEKMKLPALISERLGSVDVWSCRLPLSLCKFGVPGLMFGVLVYFFLLKPDLVVSELAPRVPHERVRTPRLGWPQLTAGD